MTTPPNDILGIHPSDIILRAAIMEGLADLRKNPWLLDFVFAALPQDALTAKKYGDKDVAAAKAWFLKNEIPVSVTPRMDEGKWPIITIELMSSVEEENTLGDIHYVPVEFKDDGKLDLTEKFTPLYDPSTGIMTIPDDIWSQLYIVPGMLVQDNTGKVHEILSVSAPTITVNAVVADFRNAIIKGQPPTTAIHLESAGFKETYQIGVFVGGETAYLHWLHSIVVFILLRYRETLLEARGFERSRFTSSDFVRDESMGAEVVFARFITINGMVKQYWPKHIGSTVQYMTFDKLKVIDGERLPEDPDEAMWVGDQD